MSENVNHPDHYTSGWIECIEAIRASLGNKEFADYCKGNIIKYLWRYRLKNGVEDLKKAAVYLNWMIEAEEGAGQRAFTHYDEICAMNVDELADFIAAPHFANPPWCSGSSECRHIFEDPVPCHDCVLDWLKQEATDGNNR